ncbi:hypothetical protein MCCARTNEY_159 [Bacillus phage vB_BanH_McCartney]|nr:hypothetical protein MCCARTNEY_159 [Bacillus phage vB_BanH_McCartney]
MKAILDNIDFENHKLLAKYIIPFLIVIDIIGAIGGIALKDWLLTVEFVFCTAYIVCNLIMQVQVKVHKPFAILLFVYGFVVAVYSAHALWTHDWENGTIYAFLVVTNLIVLKFRMNENKEESEEENHEETIGEKETK